jgi:hypothetical protein
MSLPIDLKNPDLPLMKGHLKVEFCHTIHSSLLEPKS